MKCCKECILGKSMIVNSDVRCKFNGIVSKDFYCRKFSPNPMKKSCGTCKFFKPQNGEVINFGTCATFTIRPFLANSRKGCSRYVETISQFEIEEVAFN